MKPGKYASCVTFTNIDLLRDSIILSDKLTFRNKYWEFHELVSDAEFSQAVTLLDSAVIQTCSQLFLLPFLTAEQVLFSSTKTYKLVECMQELTLARDISLPTKKLLSEEHLK